MPESKSLPVPAQASRTAHVLLAEDDDPSRHFLQAALEALDCRVQACADGNAALAAARQERYDLLLLDCRMPGAGAMQVLQQLRANPSAASHASAAIASSAEIGKDLQQRLLDAGFAATLVKPLTLEMLRTTLESVLGRSDQLTLLDHQAALRSSGNAQTLAALRGLFLAELKRLRDELDALAQRPPELSERLHPLLASCGFCGASALAKHTLKLKQCVDRDGDCTHPMRNFRQALEATVQALTNPSTDA